MARVLLTWELGGHLSHLSNIEIMARILARDRHELGVALRELQHAHTFFPGIRLQYYQAPFKQGRGPALASHMSYAHMLYTSGFAHARQLVVMLSAWNGILQSFKPDAVIFDHSPTALLASRAFNVKRLLIGSGFLIPPIETPLGVFPDVERTESNLQKLREDEQEVLAVVNAALSAFGLTPFLRLSDLYDGADETILLTFSELDPFGPRSSREYYGVWPTVERRAPAWPAAKALRLFAYLSAFPGHRALLRDLQRLDAGVVVYSHEIPPAAQREFSGGGMRFITEPVNLDAVADGCNVFVSHAAHTSVARTLLNGVPQLMIPCYKEQLFTAQRVRELGAGLVNAYDEASYSESLNSLMTDPRYKKAAGGFAARYRSFDPTQSEDRISAKLRQLLA